MLFFGGFLNAKCLRNWILDHGTPSSGLRAKLAGKFFMSPYYDHSCTLRVSIINLMIATVIAHIYT